MKRRELHGQVNRACTAPAPCSGPTGGRSKLLGGSTLDTTALFFVSYNGLVNNNSFQKNGLLTLGG
ncbi:hypothetical protein ABH941_006403 [Streptacidiphilus sp. EB103A]|jgi:hypothetical protein